MFRKYVSRVLAVMAVLLLMVAPQMVSAGNDAPAKAKISVKTAGDHKEKVTISVKKCTGADGFRFYIKGADETSFRLIGEVAKDGKKERSFTTEELKNGTYSFKVRAYKTVKGKKVWGSYS